MRCLLLVSFCLLVWADDSSIEVNIQNQLVITPPPGSEVIIANFTELSLAKAELSTVKENLSLMQDRLSLAEAFLANITSTTPGTTPGTRLVSIGGEYGVCYTSVLSYDFKLGNWNNETIGALNVGHGASPAAGFCSGTNTLVIAGGRTNSSVFDSNIATTEIYNSQKGSWSVSNPMITRRDSTTGQCLSDGASFVVCGGSYYVGSAYTGLATCEKFDTYNGQWSEFPSLSRVRGALSSVMFNNSMIVLGGLDAVTKFNTAEIFSSTQNNWVSFPSFASPRAMHGSAVVGNKIYIAGGFGGGSTFYNTIEVYDGSTGNWSQLSTTLPRGSIWGFGFANFQDSLVVIGGAGAFTQVTDVYQPLNNTWSSLAALPLTRLYSVAVVY